MNLLTHAGRQIPIPVSNKMRTFQALLLSSLACSACFTCLGLETGGRKTTTPNATTCGAPTGPATCPTPQVVNTVQLDKYAGRWYEIASTARFKVQRENGLICNQASYGLQAQAEGSNASASVSVLNSGKLIADPFTTSAVVSIASSNNAIWRATTAINGNLRGIACAVGAAYAPATSEGLAIDVQTRAQVAAGLDAIAAALQSSWQAVERLQKISAEVAAAEGRLSQQRAPGVQQVAPALNATLGAPLSAACAQIGESMARVRASVATVTDLAVRAGLDYASASSSTAGSPIDGARSAVNRAEGLVAYIVAADRAMNLTAAVDSEIADVRIAGSQIQQAAGNAAATAFSLPLGGVYTPVLGQATQDPQAPGKLTVSFPLFGAAPSEPNYWIIGLDGDARKGYEAALVYSCVEGSGTPASGGYEESAYFLSRKPTLEPGTRRKFLGLLQDGGISLASDNKLLETEQDPTRCGYEV
eukprot:jgi/Mesen1/6349/ME000328S05630